MKPLEEDNCAAMKAHYAVFSIPQAAALWCKVPEDQIDEIVGEAKQISASGAGRGIWSHYAVPCLEPRSRAIADAIEDGSLPHGREDGRPVEADEHVAYERRHIMGRDLKLWIEKAFPNDRPAFLFDDIERSSHTSISADAYRSLKAEHDKLESRLTNATLQFKKLRESKEAIESERDSLKSIVESLNSQRTNLPRHTDTNSNITDSAYWTALANMASRAVVEFPDWKKKQRQVQKTGNLMEWLKNSIGADNREAEILKKTLSDFFNELR